MVLLTSKPNFADTLNPLCPCSIEAKTTVHFFIRCQFFNDPRNPHESLNEHWQIPPITESTLVNQCSVLWE